MGQCCVVLYWSASSSGLVCVGSNAAFQAAIRTTCPASGNSKQPVSLRMRRFGGNPVCSAGGRAVLRVIEREGIQQNAAAVRHMGSVLPRQYCMMSHMWQSCMIILCRMTGLRLVQVVVLWAPAGSFIASLRLLSVSTLAAWLQPGELKPKLFFSELSFNNSCTWHHVLPSAGWQPPAV